MSWEVQTSAILNHSEIQNIYEGLSRNGIITGGVCTGTGTDRIVSYTALSAIIDGTQINVAAGSVTHDAGDASNPRMDMIVVNSSGTVSIVKGTATAESSSQTRPPQGTLSSGYAMLAAVYVPATATVVLDANVFDRRVLLRQAQVFKRKTAETQVVNNSVTLVNDDALSFLIGANEVWEIDLNARVITNTTADFKAAWDVPAGATVAVIALHHDSSGGTATVGNEMVADGTAVSFASASAGPFIHMERGLIVNGATAGTVQWQWAQDTANAVDTYPRTNSYLVARRVA